MNSGRSSQEAAGGSYSKELLAAENASFQRKPASLLRSAAPLIISTVLLGLILWRFEGWALLGSGEIPVLLLAFAVALALNCGLGGVKWWWVTRSLGLQIPLRRMLPIWLGLLPMTFFTPFMSGHLLYPVVLGRVERTGAFAAAEVVIFDKALSLMSTFGLIAAGQLILPKGHPLQKEWIFVLACIAVSAYFLDRPILKIFNRFRFVRERSRLLRNPVPWRRKLALLGVGMIYQCSDGISMALACSALGLDIDPVVAVAGFPVVLLLSYFPVTFSGFGLREGLTAGFFSCELAWDEGVAAGLLIDLFEYVGPAVFGLAALPWLLRRMRLRGRQLTS